jgi:hypothetical protein
MKYFEDFRVGETDELGSHAMTEAEIAAFARQSAVMIVTSIALYRRRGPR